MKLIQIMFFLLLVLSVVSCSPSQQSTPPNTAESKGTECPPPTPIVIYQKARDPFLVFVLIENTSVFRDEGNTKKTQEILQEFFQEHTYSGDHVVLAWLSKYSITGGLNRAVFFDDSVAIIPTQIVPTLIPTPTAITSPTPFPTRRTQIGATAVALTQAASDLKVQATQTAVSNAYNCTYTEGQQQYVYAVATSEANQIFASQEFAEKFSENLSAIDNDPDGTSKPIFEGLAMASNFITNNCSTEFKHCVLIIFSDLKDFREGWESSKIGVDVNLANVGVISVLYDCKYKDGECAKHINNWERHFKNFHAKEATFLLSNKDMVEQLETYFEQLTEKRK